MRSAVESSDQLQKGPEPSDTDAEGDAENGEGPLKETKIHPCPQCGFVESKPLLEESRKEEGEEEQLPSTERVSAEGHELFWRAWCMK